MAKKESVVGRVEQLALPIAEKMGLELWDIEYVKEGASWFLRIYIDRLDGGVTIDDCENFSKAIDGPLDEADPVPQQYYLEVSSPGIERELKKDRHFAAMCGRRVKVRLIRPLESGERELTGELESYDSGVMTIRTEAKPIQIKRAEAAFVRLNDFDEFS